MKFGFFVGVLLIVLGASMVIPFGFPILRIAIAITLVIFGIKILNGDNRPVKKNKNHFSEEFGENNSIFQKRRIKIQENQSDYNILFGRGYINLEDINQEVHRDITINVLFGDGRIKLNNNLPIKLEITSVLSNMELADGDLPILGKKTIKTALYDDSDNRIRVKVNAVLSNINIEQ